MDQAQKPQTKRSAGAGGVEKLTWWREKRDMTYREHEKEREETGSGMERGRACLNQKAILNDIELTNYEPYKRE